MPLFTTILTHPGSAHKDEFLACCVLVSLAPATVFRREPTEADLADPAMLVVDVGHRHEPELNNFDHHQFSREHPPTCSISLILQHLGLYEDARAFCDWLEPAEWFDCRGPNETSRWLGVDREIIVRLNSPIDGTLLRRFAQTNRHHPGEPLWEIMRMIGDDLLGYLRNGRNRLDFIAAHAQRWPLTLPGLAGYEVLYLPRTDPLPDDPSSGLDRYLVTQGLTDKVIGTICPDRRSAGFGLSRFRDNARLDFTRIAGEPDVHFAHAGGFVAKTSATEPVRLRALVELALVG